jgi:hypothetical protein
MMPFHDLWKDLTECVAERLTSSSPKTADWPPTQGLKNVSDILAFSAFGQILSVIMLAAPLMTIAKYLYPGKLDLASS